MAIAFVAAVFLFGNKDATGKGFIGDPMQLQTGEAKDGQTEVQPADHYKGEGKKGVTLIEYGDFECPACYGFFPELKKIEQKYGDDITVIFRHNPLSRIHPNATAAHRAAEAAARQGKFWEMHDLLYQNQPSWSREQSGLTTADAAKRFEDYAQQLGLDMDKFRADVQSEDIFNYIDSHLDSGVKLGVDSTPTIFLNGEKLTFRRFDEISAAIDQLIKDKSAEATTDKTTTDEKKDQ